MFQQASARCERRGGGGGSLQVGSLAPAKYAIAYMFLPSAYRKTSTISQEFVLGCTHEAMKLNFQAVGRQRRPLSTIYGGWGAL